jgi:mannose-1-phosphate guanylyltransferase/mannose-6-phosphate isomerase
MTVTDQQTPAVISSDRPWGHFEQFATNQPVTVKIITVEPGQRLSLQRHKLRSELWTIIDGPVDVEVSGVPSRLNSGEHAWIPLLAMHRMGNSSAGTVRVLEVAFGYFDEDDIERFDDDYERVPATA